MPLIPNKAFRKISGQFEAQRDAALKANKIDTLLNFYGLDHLVGKIAQLSDFNNAHVCVVIYVAPPL